MGLKSFKEFSDVNMSESSYRYHTDYEPYNRGKSGFSRWMSGVSNRILSDSDSIKTLRDTNDPYATNKMTTQAVGDLFGYAAKAISKIADWVTPDAGGNKGKEYEDTKGEKYSDSDIEKRRKELLDKWEKENLENKEVTSDDAEEFYSSGVLAGKKKFGKDFNPEKPKGKEEELYSSYMEDVMHKYYQKIKPNAK